MLPERQHNRDPRVRSRWWLFRRSNEQVRESINGLPRFVVTSETAKHRIFTFLDAGTKPEHRLVVFGLHQAYFLGILSSQVHVVWALAAGGTLEDRPVYNKSRCFETFPFPIASNDQQTLIEKLGAELETHRKRQQGQHPNLTITGQ